MGLLHYVTLIWHFPLAQSVSLLHIRAVSSRLANRIVLLRWNLGHLTWNPQSSTLLIILLPNQQLVYASLHHRYNLRQSVKRTPKIQSQTKMKIITWYLWLFTVIHESREHLPNSWPPHWPCVENIQINVSMTQSTMIGISKTLRMRGLDKTQTHKSTSSDLCRIFTLRKLVECITNGGLPLVSSDTQYEYSKLPQMIPSLDKNVLPMVVFH